MPVLNPSSQFQKLVGTVVNAGERARTIRVRVDELKWNKNVQKYLPAPYHLLVRDTNRSCVIGDVIHLRSNWRVSKHVRHVLTQIVTPFGTPLSERPPVQSVDELQQEYETYRYAKDLRQAARGREASARRIEEYPAIKVFDSVLEINKDTRQSLMRLWKDTIAFAPNADGKSPKEITELENNDMGEHKLLIRDLLKQMKPRVKTVVENSGEETPAERRHPISERLNQQSRNLVDMNTLRQLVGRVNKLISSLESHEIISAETIETEVAAIREAFEKSFSPSTPHVLLDSKPID